MNIPTPAYASTATASPPGLDIIETLPPWAIVAFAARCARRVRPLFNGWGSEVIDQAIELAESCAAKPSSFSFGELHRASSTAHAIALEAESSAAHAAAGAAFTAALALGDPKSDDSILKAGTGAVEEAIKAVSGVGKFQARVFRYIQQDIETIKRIAFEVGDTPITRDVFGPLWEPEDAEIWFDRFALERLFLERKDPKHALSEKPKFVTRLEDELAKAHAESSELRHELKTLEHTKTIADAERQELKNKLDQLRQEHVSLNLEKADLERRFEATRHEYEMTQPQAWIWYKQKFFTPASFTLLVGVMLLFIAVLVLILCISELHGRRSFDSQLEKLTTSRDLSMTLANGATTAQSDRRTQIDAVRAKLQLLSHAGARDFDESLPGLGYQLRGLLSQSQSEPKSERSFAFYWPPDWVMRWSSDALLSFVVMVSGTVGALMAGLRANGRFRIRDFALGLAAGFVTFLAIRGGKSVFLVDGGDTTLMLNPYNSAFLGVLTGLFTDLAYELLRDFAQEIVRRLRSAFLSDKTETEKSRLQPAE